MNHNVITLNFHAPGCQLHLSVAEAPATSHTSKSKRPQACTHTHTRQHHMSHVMSPMHARAHHAAPSAVSGHAEQTRYCRRLVLQYAVGGSTCRRRLLLVTRAGRRQTLGSRSTAARGPQPISTTRICQSELTAAGKLALTNTFAEELMNCCVTCDV